MINGDIGSLRRYRPGPLGVTPYCPIPFEIDAVREIVVGPGAEQNLRVRAVRQLLADVGSSATVRGSSAPYRG